MAHIKEYLKDWIIKTGENAVGKSIALGVYDPEIPEELKKMHIAKLNSRIPKANGLKSWHVKKI